MQMENYHSHWVVEERLDLDVVKKMSNAFDELRATIINKLMLGLIDYEKHVEVHINALDYAIWGVPM